MRFVTMNVNISSEYSRITRLSSWKQATSGSSRPQHDIRMYADLYLAGKFMLDELVTKIYPMDDIHRLIEDMHAGRLARGVLEMTPASE